MNQFIEVLKVLAPVIGGFLAVGGIGAYFTYRNNKQKISADVTVTFAEGWEKYANRLEDKMEQMEARYEGRIKDLEKLIEDKDKAHAKVVLDKDKRIDDLETRVQDLEREIKKYKEKYGIL